jgi:hypothetical protein
MKDAEQGISSRSRCCWGSGWADEQNEDECWKGNRKQAESEGTYTQDIELGQEEVAISEPVFPPDVL